MAARDDDAEDAGRRYRAPALEKGLDILELLATESGPVTLTGIVNKLGRSHGELFRMVQVLEFRGYIEQDSASDGYRVTDRLISLGMHQPRMRSLIEIALPEMRQLSLALGQSCHLGLHSRGEMVVVARMESSELHGFSVRIGYRRPLHQTASGIIVYAFQPEDVRRRWEKMFDPPLSEAELKGLRSHADAVREQKCELSPSKFVSGVTDISAPVLRGGAAAAALTMPFLRMIHQTLNANEAAEQLRATADRISAQLVEGDNRV